jgi:phosphoribosylformylglycinamidine synthase
VRAAQGCHDAAKAYGAPFVSGKDSLNNEYVDPEGVKTPIPPTLLISALGFVPDVRQAVTMDIKPGASRLYVVGETRAELGGSALYALYGQVGHGVPAPVPTAIDSMRALHRAMRNGLVLACHDCSEGGLAVAAAEMAFAGGIGLELCLGKLPFVAQDGVEPVFGALFGESSGRFLIQIGLDDAEAFERAMQGVPWACIGETGGSMLRVLSAEGQPVVEAELCTLKRAWQGG